MKFKGNVIITDPCYIIREEHHETKPITKDDWEACEETKPITKDDWEACEYGEKMEVFGIKNYLTRDTLYGDWSCSTINKDTNKKIGEFCADAGLVSVFLLDEVLAYNPDFDYHIKRPWTTTLIKDFDGDIEIKVIGEEVRVIGIGNINFYTIQTGF